ncbi:hypothetical protein K0M31_002366 [Melipona bicolor]|uniref:Uncharacterized protein n=1 Tax=Melipona bicolor TaxID=60889 RepID=A0AA40GHQ9_9HYME|nr:hypothetical protein K0M31_002366 [Melipona bicolor]
MFTHFLLRTPNSTLPIKKTKVYDRRVLSSGRIPSSKVVWHLASMPRLLSSLASSFPAFSLVPLNPPNGVPERFVDKEAALANSNVLNGRRRWRILSEIIVVFGRCNAPCFDDGPPVTTASSSLPKRLTSLSTWWLVHPVFAVREDDGVARKAEDTFPRRVTSACTSTVSRACEISHSSRVFYLLAVLLV